MASKTTAYANSAIRVFWLNDGNRTHTQSATNFCPTIRLRSTYMRWVQDLNLCKRFCRPSPSRSDNSPYCSFSRTRTYTLTFVVLCDNPFHYETICTGLQTRTVIKGFGDLHATIALNRICVGIERLELSTTTVSGWCSNQLSYTPILSRWEESNLRLLLGRKE